MPSSYIKDPDADLDYKWDFSAWLPTGDSIASHTVTVVGGDVVVGTNVHDTDSVTAWISGGTVDTDAHVQARITTAQGRVDDRTIKLLVRQQ